jgi:5'-nucleotidase / UDP-sugar diphosphatase
MALHRILLRAALAIGFLAFFAPQCGAEGPVEVTIVQINDAPRPDDLANRGGLAKLAAIIKAEQAGGRRVVVVHAGNAISPSLLSGFDQGAYMMDLLNGIGVSVMAFGNHEFDFGMAVAGERARAAKFPVILGNVRKKDGGAIDGMSSTWLYDAGGIHIAFIGLARADLEEISRPGAISVEPPLAFVSRVAPALRQAGADLVVGLGALTDGEERALVNSGLLDIVLGSSEHMHASFDGRTAAAASSRNAEHVMLLDLHLERYVVEAFVNMGVPSLEEGAQPLDAVVPRLETRFRWSVDFRSIDSLTVEPDPAIADEVQRDLLQLSRELDARIGVTDADMDIRDIVVRNGQSPFANTVVDAMRSALDADAALVNAGSIRADEIVPAGTPITRRSIVQWLPFENRVLLLRANGEQILAALENGVSQFAEHTGRFPAVSGLEVTFDPNRPAGDRVIAITIGGRPLQLDHSYSLAVNEFIAAGGDGYAMLVKAPRLVGLQTSELLVNHVVEYLSASGHIGGAAEQRVTPVSP